MKKKIIVIYKLTLLWLPFLCLLHIMRGYEVYFLAVSNFFTNIGRINKLEKQGIRWVKKSYTNFSDYARADFLAADFADKIYERVITSHIYSQINKLLRINNSAHEKKMGVVWKYYIFRSIKTFAEQIAASEFLERNAPKSYIRIIALNSYAYLLQGDLNKRINIVIIPGLHLYEGIKKAGRIIYNRINNMTSGSRNNNQLSAQDLNGQPDVSKSIDYNGAEVIYFPHQGVFFGDAFTKDHFYCDSIDSPFHKSKTLHISFYEKNANYMKENYRYYTANKIPFVDLGDIGYRKAELYKSMYGLIKQMNVKTVNDLYHFGVWIILYAVLLFFRVRKYQLILARFQHLKVALVGYDYLFPRDLAMALTLNNVRICAAEERLIIAFFPDNYLIFDYYFVASDIVRESCLKTSQVDNFIPVGLVRVDTLYKCEKCQLYDEKYDKIKQEKKFILALDFNLPADDIVDINRAAAKISETRQFYKDLIKLAKDFPSFYIVIKGKDLESYSSPYIKDILLEIETIENITIEMDLTKYNPYFIAEKADITIACHTSLCDELLAAGRKVIIYEITDRLDTLFNYKRYPIIVSNYDELKHCIEHFLNGAYLDNNIIKRIQKEFYSDCFHGNVRKNIQVVLEEIVHNWPNDKVHDIFSKC